MDWMLIWTAITAISTSIACIIALFLPIILYKIEHNKKLHILVYSRLYIDVTNNIEEPVLTIQISNIGNMPIEIQSISLMIDKNCYKQLFVMQNVKNILEMQCYVNNLPKKLDIADRLVYNFSLNLLKEGPKTSHELVKMNKRIKVVVVDTLRHKYVKNTNKTLSYYLDKLYKERKLEK